MNRKSFIIIALVLVILMLSSCSKEKKPEGMSEAHYSYGLKALEIVDSYLDFDTTSGEAREDLEVLISEQDNLPETEFKHPEHLKNFSIEHCVNMLEYNLFKADLEGGAYENVLEERNELAELLNRKER